MMSATSVSHSDPVESAPDRAGCGGNLQRVGNRPALGKTLRGFAEIDFRDFPLKGLRIVPILATAKRPIHVWHTNLRAGFRYQLEQHHL